MRQGNAVRADLQNPFTAHRHAAPAMAKLVYRSRAVRAMSPPELHALTAVAQARNGREAITGLMLYDQSRFYQWLEGPADGVERVMGSIRNDPRHTDIEVLDKQPVERRSFADWSMKLATPGPLSGPLRGEVIEPPREMVDCLHTRPETAPALLVKLVPLPVVAADRPSDYAHLPLSRETAAILKGVFLSAVVPQLLGTDEWQPASPIGEANPRTSELAELLTAPDQAAAIELIGELHAANGQAAPLYAAVFEPAARSLGDLWSEDLCTEFDVTLGLSRLQAAVRMLTAGAVRRQPSRLKHPVVLIAPEPGELHRLGAALDRTVLGQAGWSPQSAFPTDDQGLQDLLSSDWFDVLNLSLSTAFRREHRLAQLRQTIEQARRASRNPALLVTVGGRLFAEERRARHAVGADLAHSTAANVDRSILRTMSALRTEAVSRTGQVEAAATPS